MDESTAEKRENTSHRGLKGSRINRDSLPRGTLAPIFRLPRVDSGELALSAYPNNPAARKAIKTIL